MSSVPCSMILSESRVFNRPGFYGEKEGLQVGAESLQMAQIRRLDASQLTINNFAHKAAVIGDAGMATVFAALDMTAEGCGAAVLDRRHHLQLVQAQMAGLGGTEAGP